MCVISNIKINTSYHVYSNWKCIAFRQIHLYNAGVRRGMDQDYSTKVCNDIYDICPPLEKADWTIPRYTDGAHNTARPWSNHEQELLAMRRYYPDCDALHCADCGNHLTSSDQRIASRQRESIGHRKSASAGKYDDSYIPVCWSILVIKYWKKYKLHWIQYTYSY